MQIISASRSTRLKAIGGAVLLAMAILGAILGATANSTLGAECSRLLMTFMRHEGTDFFQHLGSEHPGAVLARSGSVRFERLKRETTDSLNIQPQGNSVAARLMRQLFAGQFPKTATTESTLDFTGKEIAFMELKKVNSEIIMRTYFEHLPPEGKKIVIEADLQVKVLEGSWDEYMKGQGSIVFRLTPESQKGFLEKTKKAMREMIEKKLPFRSTNKREPRIAASMFNVETFDPATFTLKGDSAECLLGALRCTAMFPLPEPPK